MKITDCFYAGRHNYSIAFISFVVVVAAVILAGIGLLFLFSEANPLWLILLLPFVMVLAA